MITFGSLFSGIGGIDLGLERAGMECRWQVECDEFCQRVLAKHWPDVPRFGDVRSVGREQLTDVDLICGGFPCQDISNAGKRAGIDGEQSGLWREFARIIGVLRPPIVLLENVAAITVRGIDRVLGDLAALGYDAEWTCFRAADVGAYHLRNRWWCVASDSEGFRSDERCELQPQSNAARSGEVASHTDCERLERRESQRERLGISEFNRNVCGIANATHTTSNGRREGGTKDPRSQGRTDAIGGGASVTHAIRQRLEVGACFEGDFAEELAAAFRSHRGEGGIWETESSLGGSPDGFPNFLARHIGRGMTHEESIRAVEDLRMVWSQDVAEAIWKAIGGLDRIQAAQVLFAFVRELKERGWLQRTFTQSEEALAGILRDLRRKEDACCTSYGQRQDKQFTGEYSDIVRDMPCQVASWNSWMGGISPLTGSVPERVAQLRALGNAVVPQVAEVIGRRIMAQVMP